MKRNPNASLKNLAIQNLKEFEKKQVDYVPWDKSADRVIGENIGRFPVKKFHHGSAFQSLSFYQNMEMDVPFWGWDMWIKGCYRKRIQAQVYMLEMPVHGVLEFTQNGNTFAAYPGDICIIQPGYVSELSTPGFCIKRVICFKGQGWQPLFLNSPLTKQFYFSRKELPWALPCIRQAQKSLYKKEIHTFLGSILQLLTSKPTIHVMNQEETKLLLKADNWMAKHIKESVQLKNLCHYLAVSPGTLGRLFAKANRASPWDEMINKRLESAKSLLALNNMSLGQIAIQCGFLDPAYFSAAFKKRVGVAPREFRKRLFI